MLMWEVQWHAGFNASPESRQPAPVAEAVDKNDSGQRAGAQVEKIGVPAENASVGELHDRAE